MRRLIIKNLRILAALTAVLLLSGCFSSNWLVFVGRDGSGTITMEFSMEKSVVEMMGGFGGGGDAPPSTSEELIDQEEMQTLAASMGDGVRFVSAEPMAENATSIGYTAHFDFDDISKVTINPMAGAPGDESPDNKDAVDFGFQSGSRPKLTISIDQSEEESDENQSAEEQSSEETAMMASMMKPFLGGMAFSVAVEVDGKISSTNASYVDGNRVTIMDFDMGKILDNEELFSKVVASDSMTEKALQEDLSAAGIRIESQEKVTIEYR